MRKIITSSVLILFFSVFASSAFADSIDDCDIIKADENAPKGLFGLCIAYHNADNGKGQERLSELFNKKAEGTEYVNFLDGMTPCPCWTDEDLINAYCNSSMVDPMVGDNLDFEWVDFFDGAAFKLFLVNNVDLMCEYQVGAVLVPDFTTVEENLTCRAGLQSLANDDFAESCE